MLSLDHVGKTYPNGVHALDGINLSVGPGEILAIVGGSGCGKSTLLRAVSGLDTPSKGRVLLDGEAVTQPHEKIGMIFQEPRLLPWLTVAENVGFGLEHRPRRERDERVADARVDEVLGLQVDEVLGIGDGPQISLEAALLTILQVGVRVFEAIFRQGAHDLDGA